MTEISFFFNVADPTDYTCRLVRKAGRGGAGVVLAGPTAALAHFDRALWSFDETEFLPHRRLERGQTVATGPGEARIWLAEDAAQPGCHDVLVNLGAEAPAGFESFAKLVEIVGTADDDRQAARARWKHYAARGYVIHRHEVGA